MLKKLYRVLLLITLENNTCLVYMLSDKDTFYMKVIVLNEIYNFIVFIIYI